MNPSEWRHLPLADQIEKFLNWFPNITQHESESIKAILSWSDETKAAFIVAKGMFEQDSD